MMCGSRGEFFLEDPVRHRPAIMQGQADLGAGPFDQPPQRGRDVCIWGAYPAVLDLWREPTVERGVSRAPQQVDRVLQERGVSRGSVGSSPAMTSPGATPSGQSTPSETADRRSVGDLLPVRLRQGAQHPDPASDHDRCRAHPGEQADLRVVLLHG